jgi:AbrB family looped-hinge helix DNA binding protein
MATSTLTTKGQVTVPKAIRDRLGLRAGDRIKFVEEDGVFRLRKHLPVSPFGKYRGMPKDLAGRDPDELVGELCGE